MSDMKRIYVVEVQQTVVASTDPATIGNTNWLGVHTTDDQDDAVRVAKEEHAKRKVNTRVRQFWVESFRPKQEALKPGQTAPKDVPLVPYTCLDHRDRVISVYSTARPPRCPDCRTSMVPVTMAEAMDKELKP